MARTSISTLLLALVIFIAGARPARADNFISPFIGYNFGGDTGCPSISNCEDKHLNWGIGVGSVGGLFGVEAEFAFIPSFFGETTGSDNSLFTFMGNFLLAPKFGPVQPYGTIGFGLIKTHTDLTLGGLIDNDQNDFGWNTGGGLMIHFSDHFRRPRRRSILSCVFGAGASRTQPRRDQTRLWQVQRIAPGEVLGYGRGNSYTTCTGCFARCLSCGSVGLTGLRVHEPPATHNFRHGDVAHR